MMILAAVFLVLLTGWMLLGWMVGESRDVRWMRQSCAVIFVTMLSLMCLGGGVVFTQHSLESNHRRSVRKFALLLRDRIHQGRIDDVRDALDHLADDPDSRSSDNPDILRRLSDVTEALGKTAHTQIADQNSESNTQRN